MTQIDQNTCATDLDDQVTNGHLTEQARTDETPRILQLRDKPRTSSSLPVDLRHSPQRPQSDGVFRQALLRPTPDIIAG